MRRCKTSGTLPRMCTNGEQYDSRFYKAREVFLSIRSRLSQAETDEERLSLQEEEKEAHATQNEVQAYSDHIWAILCSTREKVKKICTGKQTLDLSSTFNCYLRLYRLAHLAIPMQPGAFLMDKSTDQTTENEPSLLASAFERDAAARELEKEAAWREDAASMEEMSGLKFKTETAYRASSYKGLDRTNVLATPDSLIESPAGLAIFLRHARNRDPPHPMSALGRLPGPAIVSYGRACAMFGVPVAPGEDWPTQEPASANAQAEIGPDQPTTESAWRMLDEDRPPTVSILSEEEQWSLFTRDRFLPYTEGLAREYVRLVKEKERLKEAKEKERLKKAKAKKAKTEKVEMGEQSDLDNSGSSQPMTGPTGWPDVEGLDFAGFTNWIHRCEQVDENFRRHTLPSWEADKLRRYDLRKSLSGWNLEKATANGFEDGSRRYTSRPSEYYPHLRTIANIDSGKAGFEMAKPQRRR
jgi:hypothetical protein